MPEDQKVEANRTKLREAANIVGIDLIIDQGYQKGMLADANEVELHERIIRFVRTHEPYALVTLDPYSIFGKDNPRS